MYICIGYIVPIVLATIWGIRSKREVVECFRCYGHERTYHKFPFSLIEWAGRQQV